MTKAEATGPGLRPPAPLTTSKATMRRTTANDAAPCAAQLARTRRPSHPGVTVSTASTMSIVSTMPNSIQVISGDAYIELPRLADRSVDIIFTDPPSSGSSASTSTTRAAPRTPSAQPRASTPTSNPGWSGAGPCSPPLPPLPPRAAQRRRPGRLLIRPPTVPRRRPPVPKLPPVGRSRPPQRSQRPGPRRLSPNPSPPRSASPPRCWRKTTSASSSCPTPPSAPRAPPAAWRARAPGVRYRFCLFQTKKQNKKARGLRPTAGRSKSQKSLQSFDSVPSP